MIERTLLSIIILLLAALALRAFPQFIIGRARRTTKRDPLLENLNPHIPAIVYFTTPDCAPCRTQQQPALARLREELGGDVQIISIDATQNPEAADRWGVFSVPTTFILDTEHRPRQINYGVADADKLRRQIAAVNHLAVHTGV